MTHVNAPKLDTPFVLENGVTIKNRLFKSAMSEQLGDRAHNPTAELVRLYRTWAEGGIGLSITGNVMIDRGALGEPKNVVLDEQSDLEPFRAWATAGRSNGSHIWMQINHPGKQIPNFIVDEPVAPSAIPLSRGLEKGFNKPRALEEKEIWDIIRKYAVSASLAKETGFSGVQIHGAHGYLVSQFLSPRHNQREDQWGGTPENRMRFVLEVYKAIREAVGPDFPVGIKLNSADFMKDGFSESESIAVMEKLGSLGIDLIEVSGGTYESPSMVGYKMNDSTRKREAYFLEFAHTLREHTKTPLVVTGGFRTAKGMLDALQHHSTDLIGLARPLAVDTEIPNKLMANDDETIHLKTLTTGVKSIDRIAMLDITWYEHQLKRIGQGKKPKKNMSEWISFLRTFLATGIYSFRKRRA